MTTHRLRSIFLSICVIAGLMAFDVPGESENSSATPDKYQYEIQGKVIDQRTRVEVGGARVYVEHKNHVLGETETGEDGTYSLKFETIEEYTGSDLIFWVKREGYWDKSVTNVPIRPGEPQIVTFTVKRKPVKIKKDPNAKRWETIEYLKELERW